jgi:hypothetical protein
VKFHVLTLEYPLAQSVVGVVTSLTRCIVGVAEQLSVAVGTSIKAEAIPLALLHCNVWFKVPDVVFTTGAMSSITVMV